METPQPVILSRSAELTPKPFDGLRVRVWFFDMESEVCRQ